MTTKERFELESLVSKLNSAILVVTEKNPEVWTDLGSDEWLVRNAGTHLANWIARKEEESQTPQEA